MRTLVVTLLVLALPLTALAPATAASGTVTVDLTVVTDTEAALGVDPGTAEALPGTAQCSVTVTAGSSAAAVLDQATVDGCITGWSSVSFGGDRFVTEIDDLEAQGLVCILWPVACQWWEFQVDGQSSMVGVDGHAVTDGEALTFLFHTA